MSCNRSIGISAPLLILATALAAFCGRAQASTIANSQSKTNMPIQRVVALNSLAADIVFRLDETKLAGRPGSRLLEQNKKLSKIPSVSQGQMLPDIEKVIALKPELVVGSTGIHNQIAQKLEQQGIHTLLTHTDSWSHLESLTDTLANFIKADPKPLLRTYQSMLDSKLTNSPRTLVLVARDPILAPNKNSWAGDLLHQININNLTSEFQNSGPRKGFASLSAEQIIAADPEVLIVIDTEVDRLLEYYKSQPFWNQLQAVKNNKVYTFDYYGLIIPGSITAIEETIGKLKLTVNNSTSKQGR
jgi:iron complex transport system substrate-binding protein